jgi:hypothetical protein
LVRPVIVQPVLAEVQVAPPGEAVAVYPVIDAPPFEAGAAQVTATCPSAAVVLTVVGAPGRPVHEADDVVTEDETQVPARALTAGVRAWAVGTSTVSAATLEASVEVPSVTS